MLLAALAPDPRRWTSPWRRQSGGCNGEARSLSALRSRGQAGLNVGGKETVSQEEEPRSVVLPPRVDESCKPSPRWALRAGTLRSARLRLPAPANLGSERRESNDAGRWAPRALPPPPGFVRSHDGCVELGRTPRDGTEGLGTIAVLSLTQPICFLFHPFPDAEGVLEGQRDQGQRPATLSTKGKQKDRPREAGS